MSETRISHEEINRRLAVSLMDELKLSDEDKWRLNRLIQEGEK